MSGEYLDLFWQDRYFPILQQLFGADSQIRNWGYPPHYLFFVWPLGALATRRLSSLSSSVPSCCSSLPRSFSNASLPPV